MDALHTAQVSYRDLTGHNPWCMCRAHQQETLLSLRALHYPAPHMCHIDITRFIFGAAEANFYLEASQSLDCFSAAQPTLQIDGQLAK